MGCGPARRRRRSARASGAGERLEVRRHARRRQAGRSRRQARGRQEVRSGRVLEGRQDQWPGGCVWPDQRRGGGCPSHRRAEPGAGSSQRPNGRTAGLRGAHPQPGRAGAGLPSRCARGRHRCRLRRARSRGGGAGGPRRSRRRGAGGRSGLPQGGRAGGGHAPAAVGRGSRGAPRGRRRPPADLGNRQRRPSRPA